jgi:hypothetical protein
MSSGADDVGEGGLSGPVPEKVSARKPFLTKARITAAALAVGGMLVGSLVGLAVQLSVESTGLLGPSVESLIDAQASNFDAINMRLDALKAAASDPEAAGEIAELGALLNRQHELTQRAHDELHYWPYWSS